MLTSYLDAPLHIWVTDSSSSSGVVTVRVDAVLDAGRVHGDVEGAVRAGEGRGHAVLQETERVGRENGGRGVLRSGECKQGKEGLVKFSWL